MTDFDKKSYLNSYLLQELRIKRLKKLIDINPNEEYKKDLQQAFLLRENIEKSINNVDGAILSEILFQKYVFGKTLEEISFIINYSHRHTERLHKKAIEKINPI